MGPLSNYEQNTPPIKLRPSANSTLAVLVPALTGVRGWREGPGRPCLWSRRWGCDHHLVPQGSTLLHKHSPPSARAHVGFTPAWTPALRSFLLLHFPPWHQAPVLTRCQGQPAADGKVGSPCKQLLLHQVPDHPLNQDLGTFLAFLNSSLTTPHLC